MLFIYLYHGDLYSDLWKSDLHFRPAVTIRPGTLKVLSSITGSNWFSFFLLFSSSVSLFLLVYFLFSNCSFVLFF